MSDTKAENGVEKNPSKLTLISVTILGLLGSGFLFWGIGTTFSAICFFLVPPSMYAAARLSLNGSAIPRSMFANTGSWKSVDFWIDRILANALGLWIGGIEGGGVAFGVTAVIVGGILIAAVLIFLLMLGVLYLKLVWIGNLIFSFFDAHWSSEGFRRYSWLCVFAIWGIITTKRAMKDLEQEAES